MKNNIIKISKSLDEEDFVTISQGIKKYNDFHAGSSNRVDHFITVKSDKGELIGGLIGSISRDWFYIKYLWVLESKRGQNIGTTLMQYAEIEAKKSMCTGIYLETFSFQAKDFYLKCGFEVFGILDNFPRGHTQNFMCKYL